MKARTGTLCLLVILLMLVSIVPHAMAADADQDTTSLEPYIADMLDWAGQQDKTFTEEGLEIPISGTPYFIMNEPPSSGSRSIGSRVLNACGSGYNQEGSGDHSYLLVKNGDANYPNASKRQEIIDEFDDVIWPIDTTVFGGISTTRIDICVYTMDGVGGVGGYFAGGDNIWIDAADINGWGYQIMAHEFQHLIHRQHDGGWYNEELWLDEGNADLAIVLCYTGQATGARGHIMAFQATPDNDLTEFDNHGYDYGSALAYMQYVWEHYGGNATINHLVDNGQNGIASVTSTLSAMIW